MENYLILLIILNVLIFIAILFIPINEFIKGSVFGGIFILLVFEYILLKIKMKR